MTWFLCPAAGGELKKFTSILSDVRYLQCLRLKVDSEAENSSSILSDVRSLRCFASEVLQCLSNVRYSNVVPPIEVSEKE